MTVLPDDLDELTAGHIAECWRAGRNATWHRLDNYGINLRYLDPEQLAPWLPRSRDGLGSDGDNDRTIWVPNNQMGVNVRTMIAFHVSRVPAFRIPTVATDDAAWEAGRLAEQLLEASWREKRWESWRERALWFAYASGTAACWVDWDPAAETTVQTFCSIDQMTFEPGSLDASLARWGIKQQLLPPQVVRSMYPWAFGENPPAADSNYASYGTEGSAGRNRDEWSFSDELTSVLTLYVRPSVIHPTGGFAVSVNSRICQSGPWPFPFTDRLPVAIFKQLPFLENWYGKTVLDDARPIQAAIDRITSYILMGVRDITAPIFEVPLTMVNEVAHLDGSPGQRITRHGNNYNEGARYVQPGNWQSDPLNALAILSKALDDITGVHGAARGEPVPSAESGRAYEVLQQASFGPATMMARREASFWSDIASLDLMMHSHGVTRPRRWLATESGARRSSRWSFRELAGVNRVEVPSRSLDPSEERLIRQVALDGWANQRPGFDVSTLARILDYSTLDDVAQEIDPDQHNARRENERFFSLNDEVNEAVEIGDRVVVNAVLGEVHPPNALDDHQVHVAVHANDIKSERYRLLHPLLQDVIMMHYKTHEKELAIMMQRREQLRLAAMQQQMAMVGGGPQAQLGAGAVA